MKADIDKSIERYHAYEGESIEKVIVHLKRGQLKAGRFLHLLKFKSKGDKKNESD